MALYTFKIKIYDPIIVNAFARLRKSRKQSAFTLEALKYFLASEQGVQVLNLMARESPPARTTPQNAGHLLQAEKPANPPEQVERPSFTSDGIAENFCASVLGKILK